MINIDKETQSLLLNYKNQVDILNQRINEIIATYLRAKELDLSKNYQVSEDFKVIKWDMEKK